MIIVKAKNGDYFINDKAVTMVGHDEEKAIVKVYCDNGPSRYIEDVELVQYINDAEPTSWKDEGSEVQKLKAELETAGNEAHKAFRRLSYMREWIMLYEKAFLDIDSAKDSKNMRSDVDMIIAKTNREIALSRSRMIATENE
jgi:hypothetical protein